LREVWLTLGLAVEVDRAVTVTVMVYAGAVLVVRTVSTAETPAVAVVVPVVASAVEVMSFVVVTVSITVVVVVTTGAVLVDTMVVVTQV
jgi:hypothetical protein